MILVIAGTQDGRELITLLTEAGYKVMASVFSDYGRDLIQSTNVPIHTGPLDSDGLANLIANQNITMVVDGSHPYAVNVSKNAMEACHRANIPYLRYERPAAPMPSYEGLHIVHDYQQAIETASLLGKVIFLTTGSRHLPIFKSAPCLQKHRLIARILPEPNVLLECLQLGFLPQDIVALQGPFSEQLNMALFSEYQSEVIITKNSGQVGGSDTKISAAIALGLPVAVIDRPIIAYDNIFYTIDSIIQFIKEAHE